MALTLGWLAAALPSSLLAQEMAPRRRRLRVSAPVDLPGVADNLQEELLAAVVRLPLAAVLGTALALRPRRRGTPPRQPAVVQTQIVLGVVGALIMLVVGASLARAFGIVGAANLIRYRSKIEDPKDAVVMLCTLAIGLSAGRRAVRAGDCRHALHRRRAVDHRELRAADPRLRDHHQARGQDNGPAAAESSRCCGDSRRGTSCVALRPRRSPTS